MMTPVVREIRRSSWVVAGGGERTADRTPTGLAEDPRGGPRRPQRAGGAFVQRELVMQSLVRVPQTRKRR
jgi:hypothetical protein